MTKCHCQKLAKTTDLPGVGSSPLLEAVLVLKVWHVLDTRNSPEIPWPLELNFPQTACAQNPNKKAPPIEFSSPAPVYLSTMWLMHNNCEDHLLADASNSFSPQN